jgi:hypothetical protein
MFWRLQIAIVAVVLCAGCGETLTSPTESEEGLPEFASQLTPGGTATRQVPLAKAGTIQVTLTRVTPTTALGLGVGIPRATGTGCALTRSLTTGPGDEPHLTIAAEGGDLCVQVYDPGTLTETVSFAVTIATP